MNKKRLLILGGTAEARELAQLADERFGGIATIITSLAGRTEDRPDVSGEVRIGGFGGAVGLAQFIRDESIQLVIDATHPFAARISRNAKTACDETDTPRLFLNRPRWTPPEDARITYVDTIAAAGTVVREQAKRCFLTIGTKDLDAFAASQDVWFLVRTIEQATIPFARAEMIRQRPPFTKEDEKNLMQTHAIDMLVTKESGGRATEAKILAATELGIPIVMIERPMPPESLSTDSVTGALQWIRETVV